ncbi:MAG: tubulin-like doman-containing protein, partial [Cyanobacteria bacterium P01_G01_bin.39]
FLDLVSDFSAYKRSIRDNIVRAAAGQNDLPSQGRSYPRNFMSFGLATIEIPIHHIRYHLAYLLAADLCKWWLNSSVRLPVEPQTIVNARLRSMNLLGNELRRAILQTTDRSYPYQVVIQQWLGKLRQEITSENLLECRADGIVKVFHRETGQILKFVDDYLRPKVAEYLQDHFREPQNDERTHGDFFKVIYDNRDRLVNKAITRLQQRLYTVLVDRNQGLKFLLLELDLMEDSFDNDITKMEREAEKTWLVIEQAAWQEYESALFRLHEFKDLWGLTKQSKINQECDLALNNLGQALNSILERKSRILAVGILRRLKEHLTQLRHQLNTWQQRISQSQAKFKELANQQANKADALEIVGEKLFERARLNKIYQDFLAKIIGDREANLDNPAQRGLELIAQQLSKQILTESTSLWKDTRQAQEVFQLLDIEKIPQIQYPDFEKIVYQQTMLCLKKAGANTKLYQDTDACTRFMQKFTTEAEQDTRIRELFEQSQPLVRLDRNIPQSSQFKYINLAKAGLIGGDNPTEVAATKQAKILRKYFFTEEAIAPITVREKHKILAVQEVGGFSLRCLQGTEQLRRAYQDWRGQRIMAERARLRGQNVDFPPSVHLQKDIIYWDFLPPNNDTEELVTILRALEILKTEVNQNTKQNVICYSMIEEGQRKKVALVTHWENVVQVLESPDCRQDRQELERQLAEQLEAAETAKLKQELSQKLKSYLKMRSRDFSYEGCNDNPFYLREQDIIRDFINQNQLVMDIEG